MQPERVETLRQEYTDKYVVVEGERPELARFRNVVGQVKTVNFSGRALVEFDGNNNRGRYDIELDYLKVVEKPEPKPPAAKGEAAKASAPSGPADKSAQVEAKQKLSPLELARLAKEAKESGEKSPQGDTPAGPPAEAPEKPPAE
ncbi:MAG: hypothetical protein ABIK89_23950 [Planctomycetota bacterium]